MNGYLKHACKVHVIEMAESRIARKGLWENWLMSYEGEGENENERTQMEETNLANSANIGCRP